MNTSKYSDTACCDLCGRERHYRNLREDGKGAVCADEEDCSLSILSSASRRELERAIWFREDPTGHAGMIAAALHGSRTEGFRLAISKIHTDKIRERLAKS